MQQSPIEVQRYLGGIAYPASKHELLEIAEINDAPMDVSDALSIIEDRIYKSQAEISAELSDGELG